MMTFIFINPVSPLNINDLPALFHSYTRVSIYELGGTTEGDAENYTYRSPFPMLHLLRESSLEKAIASYPNIDEIPENNIT